MDRSEPTARELFDLFAAEEPESLRLGYLYVPRGGQVLSTGTTAPSLVPQFRLRSDDLAVPVGAVGPQPIDFLKTYVSIEQYAVPQGDETEINVDNLIETAASQGTLRQRITDAAVLNHFAVRPAEMASLATEYARLLRPEVGARLLNAMRRGTGEPERVLLSRQAVLASMREVFKHGPGTEPDVPYSLVAAIALVHAIGPKLYERSDYDESPQVAGTVSHLTMEFIQNELFHRSEDPLALLYRHYVLWSEYEDRVVRATPRRKPMEILREATGLDVIDWIGLGFAIWVHRNVSPPGGPMWMPRSYMSNADPTRLDRFLQIVSSDASSFAQQFADSTGAWEFLPFQQQPVLEDDGDYLLLDADLLLQRITSGLYWDVHDYEKRRYGENARHIWTQTYAEMLEQYAIDILEHIAPPILGEGKSIYSEEMLKQTYGGKVCDAVVDFGSDLCAVEIVSGQVKTGTRVKGQQADFEADTERLVLKKARQLHEITGCLVDNEPALTGRSRPIGRRVFPIIVNIGTYPVNPLSISYVEECLRQEGLLQDPRLQPLSILDINELEILEGWASSGGPTMPEILGEWKRSDLHQVALRNYAFAAVPNVSQLKWRTSSAQSRSADLFDSIVDRLGLREGIQGT